MVPFEIDAINKIEWPAWIQAGAAVFAAIGLVWNLKLQREYTRAQIIATENQVKATNSQLESAQRDYIRYLSEIEPFWEYENFNYEESVLKGHFGLILQNQNAFKVYFDEIKDDGFKLIGGPRKAQPIPYKKGSKLPMSFEITNKDVFFFKPDRNVCGASFKIKYFDRSGNEYEQFLMIFPVIKVVVMHPANLTVKAPIK